MSLETIASNEAKEKEKEKKRGPTSMYIDRVLWTKVRKTSLDLGQTTTQCVEQALIQWLDDIKGAETQIRQS